MFKKLRLLTFIGISLLCFGLVSAHSSGKPPAYNEKDSLVQNQPKRLKQTETLLEKASDINECITTGSPWNPCGFFAAKGETYHGTPTTCEAANCLCDCVPRSNKPTYNSCDGSCPGYCCACMVANCVWTVSLLPAAVAWRTLTAPWQRSICCFDTLIARTWACSHPRTYDPVFHIACICCP